MVADSNSIASEATVRSPDSPAPRPRRGKPRVRAVSVDFAEVPRHWLQGTVLGTALVNGVNLLFPAGERFFIRSVRHFLPLVDDPTLREEVRNFFGQEGRHAGAHERFFAAMEGHGYSLRGFLSLYERVTYGFVEQKLLSPELRLSVTAALEHYTAVMADNVLHDGLFDGAPAAMRRLLLWHACEELEHRAVAFDVLQKVNPSYGLRMAGMAVATFGLGVAWALATRHLLAQETPEARGRIRGEMSLVFADGGPGRQIFLKSLRSYLRRDFHPLDEGDDAAAKAYLASQGLEVAT